MYVALQVLTVMLAAVTMALSLVHALEFPGKLRLKKEQYLAIEPIYYPGSIGGIRAGRDPCDPPAVDHDACRHGGVLAGGRSPCSADHGTGHFLDQDPAGK
jgi:hypothetical protein